jgi:serine protease Do
MQDAVRKAVDDASPSVVCILVSRNEGYKQFGDPAPADSPGRLAGFDADRLRDEAKKRFDPTREALVNRLDLARPDHIPESVGSGIVVGEAGLVLTNYHVVREAMKVYVRLPGGKGSYADIHAADPRSDLAVLRLLNPRARPLPAIRLGDADKLERGHFVLSIANVFAAGFRDGQPSASWGILSNIRRRAAAAPREEDPVKPLHHYGTLLQTDCRLHLGCSGGALVNLQGELVGLTTALAAIQGGETPGGFAIPVNAGLRRVIDTLKRGEEVEYGFLGVHFEERVPDGAPGVALSSVMPGSPAKNEGKLRDRDVIVAINGTPLQQSDDLLFALGTQLVGSRVRLQVRRGKEVFAADVTLAKLYVPGKKIAASLGKRPFYRGLRVDYTSLLAQKPPRQSPIPPGVLVTDVQTSSPAERASFKAGDIITHVNRVPVNSPPAFYDAARAAADPVELTLYNYSSHDPPTRVFLK